MELKDNGYICNLCNYPHSLQLYEQLQELEQVQFALAPQHILAMPKILYTRKQEFKNDASNTDREGLAGAASINTNQHQFELNVHVQVNILADHLYDLPCIE